MNTLLHSISQVFIKNNEQVNENNENLIEYIEKIQTKFVNQIEKLNLENEELKKKLELSEKTSKEYYNKYLETKECLEIHVQVNNNLTESINKSKQNQQPTFLNMFNEYFK